MSPTQSNKKNIYIIDFEFEICPNISNLNKK